MLLKYKFSVAFGEITRIDNRWYVTHAGLLLGPTPGMLEHQSAGSPRIL